MWECGARIGSSYFGKMYQNNAVEGEKGLALIFNNRKRPMDALDVTWSNM